MTLPRPFRQQRIGLIGFGDVARRLLFQRIAGGSSHGPRFIAISRSAGQGLSPKDRQHATESGVHFLRLDLDCPRAQERISRLFDRCLILMPPAEQGLRDGRVARLAQALRRQSPTPRGVYISTTGVYGNYDGAIVTETAACLTRQPRSLRRLHAEQVLRRQLGFHVLRVPGIYAHDRLPIARLRQGAPALVASDDVFTNHIHADDLARIAWAALFKGRTKRLTNTVDASRLKMADYFDLIADAFKLPRPARVSKTELKTQAASGHVSEMMLGFLSESRLVRSVRVEKELRISLRFPTIQDTLADLKPGPHQKD
jgi:hypothetical protein